MDTWKKVLTSWVLDAEAEVEKLPDEDKALGLCAVGIYRQILAGYTERASWVTDEATVYVMLDQAARCVDAVGVQRRDQPKDYWRIVQSATKRNTP
ncbi:hypothetical protein ABT282_08330 [Streptomyces sp. NPDC000927]|uniref:hypothetical protein n=1 Tax=Streptomyces sp. NPDC000927 TaxID=3154371 RepID=UPI0033205C72